MCNERDGGRSLSFHSVPYGPSFILAVSRNPTSIHRQSLRPSGAYGHGGFHHQTHVHR